MYIPSKLAEVFEIADRVIILRNGKIATALSIDETNLEELPELTFSSEKALLSVVNTKFSQLEDTSEDMEDFINYSISLFNKLLHIDKLCIIWNESGNVRLGTSKTIDDFYPGLKENLYNIKETILKLTNELNHNEVEKAITQKISHIEEKFKYIPITYGKEVLGTALVFGKSFDRYLDNKILFHNLFNYLSISFNNYIEKEHEKREERELQIAGQIQHNLTTPNFNSFTKLDVYGYSKAAKIVGGDYFDLFKINDYKYVGIMVDVSGKGIPAALIMVMIRSIIKNTINVNITANELMSVLNNALVGEIPEDRYATTYLFIIDTKKHIIDFCNGGHHSMILIRNDKDKTEIYSLDSDGIPVGIVSNYDYQNKKTIIKDKDMFILYTDGITEAMNKDREEFGKNRLIKIISKYQYLKSRDISMLINKAITKFTEGKQHDDETILIFKLV